MSQYASSYGPYAQESFIAQLSPLKKALLLGAGALLAHRAGIGIKRALITTKMRTGAMKALPREAKMRMLKEMGLSKPYENWAKKKMS